MNRIKIIFEQKAMNNVDYDIIDDFSIDGTNFLTLSIITNNNKSFNELISNKDEMKESFKLQKYFYKTIVPPAFYDDFIEERRDFFSEDYDVLLCGSIDDIKDFIDKNEELKNKKIIVSFSYEEEYVNVFDSELIDVACDVFKNYDNIYVDGEGNSEIVNLSEYKKTLDYIDLIVNHVKQYDFSPLEQLMYVYDIVRDRIYIEENKNESYSSSRDLTSVITGDKIVCVGFAKIYDAIIEKLGFNSSFQTITKKNNKSGHIRNIVYVKDDLYDVDGLYFFDPTWDCKNDKSNDYLDSYMFFAKTLKQISKMQRNYNEFYIEKFDNDFIKNVLVQYKLRKIDKKTITFINGLARNVQEDYVFDLYNVFQNNIYYKDVDELEDQLYTIYKKLYFEIPYDVLFKALFNVRRVEYYENPKKYTLNLENLIDIAINSRWIKESLKPEEIVLLSIFGESIVDKELLEKNSKDLELDKKIEQVKLTKTLQLALKKVNSK